MKRNDIPLVLGGGPAGSMFALTLARAGRDVTLLEKSKEPHNKVCGEFISRESIHYLERHGLHPASLGAVPVRTVRFVTRWFQRESALPFTAWSLTRRKVDEALLTRAAAHGVQVIRDAHVTSLEQRSGLWSATLRDGRSFQAGKVVLATGKLDVGGWPRPLGTQPHLIAFKMYYRLTEAQREALGEAVELVLHAGGYTGLQPVEDGIVNLCVLVDARHLRSTGSQWNDVLQYVLAHAPHLQARLQGAVAQLPKPLAASRIPYGHLQRITQDGLWRVGDQAAVIPSFSGDGTAIALHSGALAATSVLHGHTAAFYQQQLYRQLSARMWFATRLSQVLVDRPRASQVTRAFPGLIRTIASLTRIPDSALMEAGG